MSDTKDLNFDLFQTAITLIENCQNTCCTMGEECPFRDTVNSHCRIGYPEEWDLSDVHYNSKKGD